MIVNFCAKECGMIIKIVRIVFLLAIFGYQEMWAIAQNSFCALKISAVSEDGTPLRNAFAELVDPSGQMIRRQEVVEGRAEFCDFGFGYHSILVRGKDDDTCDTMVKNVKVIYGRPQQIKVILNSCLEYRIADGGNACFIYLRVSSKTGERIQTAKILKDDGLQIITDEYGRAQIGIRLFSGADLTFSKNGYETRKVHVECPYVPVEKEMTIEMLPQKD
jgi:hypothetical protein